MDKSFSADPVQRLFLLLREAQLDNKGSPIWVMWCRVLALEAETPEDFLPRYQDLLKLYDSAVDRMNAVEEIDKDLFLVWVRPVRSTLNFSILLDNWEKYRNQLSPTVIQALQFSAHESSKHPLAEEAISNDTLLRIKEDVEKLHSIVLESELDSKLKELLSIQLECIRQALIAYRIVEPLYLKRRSNELLARVFYIGN